MARRRRRSRGFRWWWPVAAIGAIAAIALVIVLAGWLWLRGSLPTVDGDQSVDGLTASVEIIRDSSGIPHIFAENQLDAYFALGFVHAQDRLWHMEFNRRLGAARLSEVFGARTLKIDKFLRTLGVYRVAEENFAHFDPDVQATYQAYSDGVNAYLSDRSGPLPLEFLILGHEPEPWHPIDSIVWFKMMAWDLGSNAMDEVLRSALSEKLSDAQIADLWPTHPVDGPVALAAFSARMKDARTTGIRAADLLAAVPLPPTPGAGSNNWVISGQHTTSGKPFLANDPHLSLQIPNLWYLAHINAPGLNVIGATFPGTPAFVLGRTDTFAWGFTNTNPDVQDLFIERRDPANADRYLTPNGSEPFVEREETIRVRDGEDVQLTVRETRHGPVVDDILDNSEIAMPNNHVLALAWTALMPDDMTGQSAIRAGTASDWDTWVAAMREYHAPQQNMVFADTFGNIGYLAPGRIPIRRNGNGWMPSPGWTGDYDWIGFVPFAALPRTFNPSSGRVVTANNKVVGADYAYFITEDWAPPFRAERIEALLDAREKHDSDSFTAIQRDVVSLGARKLLPVLGALAAPITEDGRTALDALTKWDGVMDAERIEPLIYFAWLRELSRALFADDLGDLFSKYWSIKVVVLERALEPGTGWCDNQNTDVTESCGGITGQALDAAVQDLTKRYGNEPENWRWGQAHYAYSTHRVLGQIPVIGPLFEIRIENGGSRNTINAAGFSVADNNTPFVQNHGPGYRAIYDLAAPDRSLFMHTTGQSGNPLSAHYKDLAELWQAGRHVPMVTGRTRIESDSEAKLVLHPR